MSIDLHARPRFGGVLLGVTLFGAALLAGCSHDEGAPNGKTPAAASGRSVASLLESASTAMGSDDWKKALVDLDVVVADPRATAEEKAAAWQDKVVCEGQVGGDAGAIAALKKLADSKVALEAKQYFKMGNDLADADRLQAALAVIEVATEKFKGDAKAHKQFKKLAKNLAAKLAAAGDTAGRAKLDSLGYLSGDDDEN